MPSADDRPVFRARSRRARSRRSRGVIACPWRNRAASAAVKASAGMSSSAVSIGSRCSEAARLCPSATAKSSEIACASVKRPDRQPAQFGDMAERAERLGEIAGQRHGYRCPRRLRPRNRHDPDRGCASRRKLGDLDRARRQFGRLAGAGQRIGAAPGDLDRRIGRRALPDRAGKARQSAAIAAASGRAVLSPVSRLRDPRYRSRRPSARGSDSFLRPAARIARSSSPRRAPSATRRSPAGRACRHGPTLAAGARLIAADNPARGDPGRLVDDQPAMQRRVLSPASSSSPEGGSRSRSTSGLVQQCGDARGAVERGVERKRRYSAPGAARRARASMAFRNGALRLQAGHDLVGIGAGERHDDRRSRSSDRG